MKLFSWIIILLVAFSCESETTQHTTKKTDASEIQFAVHFKLIDRQSFKELQLLDPESGKIERKLALIPRGIKLKLNADYTPIEIPVRGIVALSGTHIGMLSKLNALDKIVGVSSMDYVFAPTLKKRHIKNPIAEFIDLSTLNPVQVHKTGADLVVFSGFGTTPPQAEKLEKLGIRCVPNYDWRETNPLGKAEWIKVFGALLDQSEAANSYFDAVVKSYQSLQIEAKKHKTNPEILSGSLISDTWYLPAKASFNAQLIRDAQAKNSGDDFEGTGSATYTLEQILSKNKQFDFWINTGFDSEQRLLAANQRYRYLKPLQTKNVYCYSHNMNHFWENSAIEPHHVLSDYIQIFHSDTPSTEKLYFYRKLKP